MSNEKRSLENDTYSIMLYKVLEHVKQCCVSYTCVVQKFTNSFIRVININHLTVERRKRENGVGFPII